MSLASSTERLVASLHRQYRRTDLVPRNEFVGRSGTSFMSKTFTAAWPMALAMSACETFSCGAAQSPTTTEDLARPRDASSLSGDGGSDASSTVGDLSGPRDAAISPGDGSSFEDASASCNCDHENHLYCFEQ